MNDLGEPSASHSDDCSLSGPDAVSEISARELLRIGPSAASPGEDWPEDGRK